MKKMILAVIVILAAPLSVFALNYGELRTMSRLLARDTVPPSGQPRISEIIVSSFTNIAQQQIAMFTWCSEDNVDMDIVAGQREYSYTDDMIAIERVTLDGNLVPATSIAKLDQKNSNWSFSPSTVTPTVYYSNPGLHVFGFDTIPSTRTDHVLNVTYIKQPTALVNDTDIPFDGQTRLYPFHNIICFYVAAMMCYSDNRATEGDKWYAMYVDNAKNMTSTIRLSPDYAPSFSGSSNGR